ncbi:MAG: hypothetical protein HQL57_09395, partial [Magnetococcales bacterium]|nr:hypothetical protein [Magnetococcales bacterium]
MRFFRTERGWLQRRLPLSLVMAGALTLGCWGVSLSTDPDEGLLWAKVAGASQFGGGGLMEGG